MRYPPIKYAPQALTIYNGAPCRSQHAIEVDRYQTWIACVKRQEPVMIGSRFVAGITYTLEIEITQYTQHIRFGFLCSGAGTITIGCDDDSYDAVIQVDAGSGASGSHSLAEATMYWSGEPMSSVSASTHNRSLDVTYQASSRAQTVTWAITDRSGNQSLRVYAVDVRLIWPDESAVLPA